MAWLVIEHLSKVFSESGGRVRAVQDLSLSVKRGEFLVLAGPSGCGKTTTLRLIAGLEEPDGGTIRLEGEMINRVPPKDRDVAMVFQNHALYPHLTARENLEFGLKLRRCPRVEREARVREAAEVLGLVDCLDRKPSALSGGQRQRVALGRALVRRPKLFLFDEPLANLDPQLRLQMRAELTRLHRRLGLAMVYVTHDHIEAMALGQRIAVMQEGKLQQVAPPLELYERPANLFVAGFIGSPPMNFFKGTVTARNGALVFEETGGAWSLPLPRDPAGAGGLNGWMGKPLVLGLRPENIGLDSERAETQETHVEAVVEAVELLGAETHLHWRAGAGLFTARVPSSASVSSNQKVRLRFETRRAVLFDPESGKALVEP